jgi:hypothetical protein
MPGAAAERCGQPLPDHDPNERDPASYRLWWQDDHHGSRARSLSRFGIAARLVGDASTVPQVWPDVRFDLVWVFEPDPNGGGLELRQVPQLLLAGDRAEPIAWM